jgi:hypothetical protein
MAGTTLAMRHLRNKQRRRFFQHVRMLRRGLGNVAGDGSKFCAFSARNVIGPKLPGRCPSLTSSGAVGAKPEVLHERTTTFDFADRTRSGAAGLGRPIETAALSSRRLHRFVRRSGKLFNDRTCKKLVDLAMPRHWLCHARARVLIPVVPPTMSDQNASHLLDLLDQVSALHATSSSAALRAAGMCPPDRSAYRSRK